jgi:ABC-type polysaccharide/polyol phosphate export permease
MVICLEGLRWAIFPGAVTPSTTMLVKGVGMATMLFISGAVFFSRIERTIVDRV